jgi:hypothetical protein
VVPLALVMVARPTPPKMYDPTSAALNTLAPAYELIRTMKVSRNPIWVHRLSQNNLS